GGYETCEICALVRLWAVVVCAAAMAALPLADGAEANAILKKTGIQKGICVVLGLPEAGHAGLVADLAKSSQLMIYFQSADANEVAQVKERADTAGVLGDRVFAERGEWKSIGLADNLAGAILVAPAAEKSVSRAELLRVLHPQGKALLAGSEISKPFPLNTDDWRYPYHGPDNNPQSRDQVARAPYLTQFIAEPKFCPSPAVTVAAGGRVFRACGHLAHHANQNAMLNTLQAINAYNGTILWQRPLKEGFMVLRNTFIATPETLYVADDESCKLLDAATGRLRDEIAVSEKDAGGAVWKWMALEKGVLYALIGGREFAAPVLRAETFGLGGWPRANWPGFDYPDPKTAWAQGQTLLAVDTKTKKLLWQHRAQELVDGRAVCMKNGRIYFLSPKKFLACVRAATGDVLWKTTDAELLDAIGPLFHPQPRWTGLSPFPYVKCNDRYVFFSGPRMSRVVAVSAKDGRLAWQRDVVLKDGGSVHLLLRDDAVWTVAEGITNCAFRMDYDTGKTLSHFLGRRGCTMATGSADSIFYRAQEGTVRIETASSRAEHIAPMRPPCYDGVIISDGMLFWGAWKCRCPLSLYGNIGLAPAGRFNSRVLPNESRLELGSGDSTKVEKLDLHPDDWPCSQGNNRRTCVTKVAIPKQAARRWAFKPSTPALPTAPVAAGGMIFVGDRHGVLRALDSADGALRWQARTGGPVFSAPAVWNGRVYVGSADGHVYAYEARTGRLLWRFLAAPARQRIPVFGQLISRWPVAGGVVVENGVVYAAAGIAHYDGTHVCALDAITGKPRWHNGRSGRLSPQTGSGISLQGELYIERGELRFHGGNTCESAAYDLATGRCTSAPSDRVAAAFRTAFYAYYPERGGYVSLNHALADGKTLSYQADYSGSTHSTLALFEPLPPDAQKQPPDWRIPLGKNALPPKLPTTWEHRRGPRYNSFIIAPGVLLAAGQAASGGTTEAFIAALRIEDGSDIWRCQLPAGVVKGGTAVDHQARIFASLEDGQVFCFAGAD
ncbi:MAG: hypothetical protein FJ388_02645, partial [Verrucomicrobia bacterium]|nr:hypothetical protein [Verrucomicrobiota bacterium]